MRAHLLRVAVHAQTTRHHARIHQRSFCAAVWPVSLSFLSPWFWPGSSGEGWPLPSRPACGRTARGFRLSSVVPFKLARSALATSLRFPRVVRIGNPSAVETLATIGGNEVVAVSVRTIHSMGPNGQPVCLVNAIGMCQMDKRCPNRIVVGHCVLILSVLCVCLWGPFEPPCASVATDRAV